MRITRKRNEPLPANLASVPEVATITGITTDTIWRKIRSGVLPAWGPRRCFRVSIAQLLAPVPVRTENDHALEDGRSTAPKRERGGH